MDMNITKKKGVWLLGLGFFSIIIAIAVIFLFQSGPITDNYPPFKFGPNFRIDSITLDTIVTYELGHGGPESVGFNADEETQEKFYKKFIFDQTIAVQNKEEFDDLCFSLLAAENDLDIYHSQPGSYWDCEFKKIFPKWRFWGLRNIILLGRIRFETTPEGNSTFDYESYWIERYSNNRSRYVDNGKYRKLLDTDQLIIDIKEWEK